MHSLFCNSLPKFYYLSNFKENKFYKIQWSSILNILADFVCRLITEQVMPIVYSEQNKKKAITEAVEVYYWVLVAVCVDSRRVMCKMVLHVLGKTCTRPHDTFVSIWAHFKTLFKSFSSVRKLLRTELSVKVVCTDASNTWSTISTQRDKFLHMFFANFEHILQIYKGLE